MGIAFRFDEAVGREYLLREVVGAGPPSEPDPRVDRLDDRPRDPAFLHLPEPSL